MVKKEKLVETNSAMLDKIMNRNSILKIMVLSIFSLLLAYKIAISDLSFDFSKFDFSDLLSLIVALFSIVLAVSFYFKATDTSNKFYDNTYKFTKDISEILGRIEAGFGERLRHLDEGYTGIWKKFDGGIRANDQDVETAQKEFEVEKHKLEKEMREKNDIISSLMEKAKLSKADKEIFLDSLKNKEKEISNLFKELDFHKRELSKVKRNRDEGLINSIPESLQSLIKKVIKVEEMDRTMLAEAPISFIKRKLKIDKGHLPSSIIRQFVQNEIIEEDGSFTQSGLEIFKDIAKRM